MLPKAKVLDTSARVPGTDGEKMSKSYNNTLLVFEDAKVQRKQIMRIVTDSRPMDQPKEPAGDVLYDLFALVATEPSRRKRWRRSIAAAASATATSKRRSPTRRKNTGPSRGRGGPSWRRSRTIVKQVLADGAATARKKAAAVLKRVQDACGVKGW